jgi:integrase/recombinase XerD
MSSPALLRPAAPILPALFQTMPEGGRRFWKFFTVNIRNPNTRRTYFKAVEGFAAWCEEKAWGICPG